jgi:transmembrane sensor
MNQSEIQKILTDLKKKNFSASEAANFIRLLEDTDNEQVIKECLFNELDNTMVNKIDVENVNFSQLFRSIRHRIHQNRGIHDSNRMHSKHYAYRVLKVAAVFMLAFAIGGLISYYFLTHHAPVPETFSEISTPFSSTSKIMLSDGTEVIMNAGSKLNYGNAFNLKNRTLYLEGEAYFKVAENKQLPFTVVTSHLNIIALGTEFNVKAYPEEKIIVTTLIKGKIEVLEKNKYNETIAKVMLEPNQKAIFIKDKESLAVDASGEVEEIISRIPAPRNDTMYVFKEIDTEPSVVWTENKMILSKESMASLAIKLERKYDVDIRFADEEVKNFRFTGTLLDETIQQVLDAIRLSAPISYTMEGKTITIFENRKMTEQFRQHLKQR